jgi:hypothetical protein
MKTGVMQRSQLYLEQTKYVTPKHPSGYRVLGITRDFRSER